MVWRLTFLKIKLFHLLTEIKETPNLDDCSFFSIENHNLIFFLNIKEKATQKAQRLKALLPTGSTEIFLASYGNDFGNSAALPAILTL